MKLVEFSVTNYRSITSAHKIVLKDLTVLVGKNNEGKSNLLTALNVAMKAMMIYGHVKEGTDSRFISRLMRDEYIWQRDFPLQFQGRKSGLESIFNLNFRLEGSELSEFHRLTGIRGNEDIPICVKFSKDDNVKIEVPKRGSSSYKQKSQQVTEFISKRITFNYIQAIRTDKMAIRALEEVITDELLALSDNPEYKEAQNKIEQIEQSAFNNIASQLVEPLHVFIPGLQKIEIRKRMNDLYKPRYRNDFEVMIDDGILTNISNKGDGIKSLVTLAILKERKKSSGASIIAIEEPESHLHSGAIHRLVDVLHRMSENSQVIITTHNPLFVQQNQLNANILVDSGTAKPAKSISEIRNILGVLPSDNLRNARFVLVVEGEDDKISLSKILPAYSTRIKDALEANLLVIKSLGGAGNLSHDLADLKNSLCQYVVLLDNDQAGKDAADKAIKKDLLKESEVKYTICNGCPESEMEDCLQPDLYTERINQEYSISLKVAQFRSKGKWSDRVKQVFLSQGSRWNEDVENKVKMLVAYSIPDNIDSDKEKILIPQKSGFLDGLVTAIEAMLPSE